MTTLQSVEVAIKETGATELVKKLSTLSKTANQAGANFKKLKKDVFGVSEILGALEAKGLNRLRTSSRALNQSLGRVSEKALGASESIKGLNTSIRGMNSSNVVREREQFNKLSGSIRKSKESTELFRRSLEGVVVLVATGEFARLSNEYQEASNRIRTVTESTKEFKDVQTALFKVATDTRSAFENTAELYQKVAIASSTTGASQKEQIEVTSTLNKLFISYGLNLRQQQSVLFELGEALDSGSLKGRNFNRLMIEAGGVMKELANTLGITTSQFKEMASQGQISSKTLMKAIEESTKDVNKRFAKTQATLGQSTTIIKNALERISSGLAGSSGITKTYAGLAKLTANNVDLLKNSLIALVPVLATVKISTLLVSDSARVAEVSFKALRLAISSTGIGLLIIGVGELITKFEELKDKTGSTTGVLKDLGKKVELSKLKSDLSKVSKEIKEIKKDGASVSLNTKGSFGFGGMGNIGFTIKKQGDLNKLIEKQKSLKEKIESITLSISKIERKGKSSTEKDLEKQEKDLKALRSKSSELKEKSAPSISLADRELQSIRRQTLAYGKQGVALERLKIQLGDYGKSVTLASAKGKELLEATRKLERIKTLSSIANSVGDSFASAFADAVTGVKTLGDAFRDFTRNVIADIAKIAAEKAASSIVSSLLDSVGFASGAAFSGGEAKKFAGGGVINSPTFFAYQHAGKKKLGQMGEVAEEAILPLKTNSKGQLGVHASGVSSSGKSINISNTIIVKTNDQGTSTGNAQEIARQVEGAMNKWGRKQMKPGGLFR